MALMSDEKYEYTQDLKEKRSTARSARNRRGHCGKGGRVILPSDRLTAKQLAAKNGKCVTYHLGSPMSWEEFISMPDDLQSMYISSLRKKFNVPDEELAAAMDVDISMLTAQLNAIKVKTFGTAYRNWYDTDDYGRFRTWWAIREE